MRRWPLESSSWVISRFDGARRRWRARHVLALLAALAVALGSVLVWARPGGGHAFSGGPSGGGGGFGGGGGDGIGVIVHLLIWLLIRNPSVGIPVVLVVVGVLIVKKVVRGSMQGWATSPGAGGGAVQRVERAPGAGAVPRSRLDEIRRVDPAFSVVVFEDFSYFLYAAVHRARAQGFAAISAYVADEVAGSLRQSDLTDVHGIIIGAVRIVAFSGLGGPRISVQLELEANYVEVGRDGKERRYYVVDRLALERAADARSRPSARASTLDCPNCGAPLEALRGAHCTYCQQDVGYGRFDWQVVALHALHRESRGPLLTSDVREEGTERPTRVGAGAATRLQSLQSREPSFAWEAFSQRVSHIWSELQGGWSAREALRIRPHVSDNLFQSMVYWLDLYSERQCRNVTERGRILRIELANVLSDESYDAITVRLFATGLDYTVADDGRLLSGSRRRERTYSEYWTLIRGRVLKGEARGEQQCPNCGAPLRVGMAGNCEYCQVKVTTGEFDWVLSRIEQDEAYTG